MTWFQNQNYVRECEIYNINVDRPTVIKKPKVKGVQYNTKSLDIFPL